MHKVSLYLDEQLWESFRIACLRAHISGSKQIGLLLVQFLHEQECQETKAAKAERKRLTSGDESPRLAAG